MRQESKATSWKAYKLGRPHRLQRAAKRRLRIVQRRFVNSHPTTNNLSSKDIPTHRTNATQSLLKLRLILICGHRNTTPPKIEYDHSIGGGCWNGCYPLQRVGHAAYQRFTQRDSAPADRVQPDRTASSHHDVESATVSEDISSQRPQF